MKGAGPWRTALAAGLIANAPALEAWEAEGKHPRLLSNAQAQHAQAMAREVYREVTTPAGEEDALAQARVDCLTEVLERGVPRAERGQWEVEVRSGARARTSTVGEGYISVTPEHADDPGGLGAVAFILAHEMAHNIAEHIPTKMSATLARGEAPERAADAIAQLDNEQVIAQLVKAYRAGLTDAESARSIRMEYEADRGALHILHRAKIPLDGAKRWMARHAREAPAEFEEITHPHPEARHHALKREARRIERGGRDQDHGLDRSRACTDKKLKRRGWIARALDKIRSASANPERDAGAPKGSAGAAPAHEVGDASTTLTKELEQVRGQRRQLQHTIEAHESGHSRKGQKRPRTGAGGPQNRRWPSAQGKRGTGGHAPHPSARTKASRGGNDEW